jgi:LytS/YehU family sensor histidine kinase
MIRLTLNHSKETFVTLQETIEYLNAYLEMEQLRFGSSFTYQIEVCGKSDDEEIGIPTLMIQPLVENAIWHGLMHTEGDKRILIRFAINDDWVSCSIQDNGIGIRKSEKMNRGNRPPSVGLDNLRNRIKIMNEKYKTSCTLLIEDLGETGADVCGTSVILRFKIVHDKRIIA